MSTVARQMPDMPLQQRLDALARANVIRTKRAKLKRDLKARKVEIRDVLTDPPQWVDTMKVAALLLAVPKMGHAKVNKILKRCCVSPSKTVAGLNDRQRRDLIAALRRDPVASRRAPMTAVAPVAQPWQPQPPRAARLLDTQEAQRQ